MVYIINNTQFLCTLPPASYFLTIEGAERVRGGESFWSLDSHRTDWVDGYSDPFEWFGVDKPESPGEREDVIRVLQGRGLWIAEYDTEEEAQELVDDSERHCLEQSGDAPVNPLLKEALAERFGAGAVICHRQYMIQWKPNKQQPPWLRLTRLGLKTLEEEGEWALFDEEFRDFHWSDVPGSVSDREEVAYFERAGDAFRTLERTGAGPWLEVCER